MSENLLQFIWLHRLYDSSRKLLTIDGDEINILHPGLLNTNAGPDFLEAKIKIGNTLWVGHIELHKKSSDWNKHQHHLNTNYDKLILHVVYEYDTEIINNNDFSFPTLELQTYISKSLLIRYEKLMRNNKFIACEDSISTMQPLIIHQQLSRMLADRFEEKTLLIQQQLKSKKNNWQEIFYIQLARGFGIHINQDIFEQLALNTPLQLLTKHKNNRNQIEALLFGQAGFLDDYFDENFPLFLQKEYNYLKSLYQLNPLQKSHWKFLRLRPANFPTIRIAQFAALITSSHHLFSKLIEATSIQEIEKLFHISLSDYWQTHYSFEEKSVTKEKSLGKTFIQTLIINVVIPMLYNYGKQQGKNEFCDKAINFLEKLAPEKNSIIESWKLVGIVVNSAAETQALLQLKHKYCDTKRCLECCIGYRLLK